MTRATVSSALPAEYCERVTDTERALSPRDERAIETRADEIVAGRMRNLDDFRELMDQFGTAGLDPHIHRAIVHIQNALAGDPIARTYVLQSVYAIFLAVRAQANQAWLEDARETAEGELDA